MRWSDGGVANRDDAPERWRSRPDSRRPKPRDAFDLAHATFRSGVRLEMGTLAAQLGISQPTLYRWVGTREQLLDTVLERITDETVAGA